MRPVRKSRANANFQTPTTLSFAGTGANAIKKVLQLGSATNIPVRDCLDAWLDYVEGKGSLGGTKAEQARAVVAIQNKVASTYKCAAVPLTQELGAFCSFCETPLSGLLEVEHCVPKSEYPTFALTWDNFLLACSPCNTAKGSIPSRTTVRGWTQNPTTEQNYYDEIRSQHYVWADVGGESHAWLPINLESHDPTSGNWSVLPMGDAAHLDNYVISHDIATRTVEAGIHDSASNQHVQRTVRTQLAPFGPNQARGIEMLALCALNDNGNFTSTYDRRVLNRTIAWFRCLASLKTYLALKDPAAQLSAWNLLLQNSAAVGFYSAWLSIIRFHNPKLAGRFVTDTNQNLYYPGTDPRHLP